MVTAPFAMRLTSSRSSTIRLCRKTLRSIASAARDTFSALGLRLRTAAQPADGGQRRAQFVRQDGKEPRPSRRPRPCSWLAMSSCCRVRSFSRSSASPSTCSSWPCSLEPPRGHRGLPARHVSQALERHPGRLRPALHHRHLREAIERVAGHRGADDRRRRAPARRRPPSGRALRRRRPPAISALARQRRALRRNSRAERHRPVRTVDEIRRALTCWLPRAAGSRPAAALAEHLARRVDDLRDCRRSKSCRSSPARRHRASAAFGGRTSNADDDTRLAELRGADRRIGAQHSLAGADDAFDRITLPRGMPLDRWRRDHDAISTRSTSGSAAIARLSSFGFGGLGDARHRALRTLARSTRRAASARARRVAAAVAAIGTATATAAAAAGTAHLQHEQARSVRGFCERVSPASIKPSSDLATRSRS